MEWPRGQSEVHEAGMAAKVLSINQKYRGLFCSLILETQKDVDVTFALLNFLPALVLCLPLDGVTVDIFSYQYVMVKLENYMS